MKRLLQKGPFLLMIALFLLLFSPVIFQNRQFGFRDDSFFYLPLFQYIQSYWNQGELPLWDPAENFGMPLAANPTSSVFYPLKLIFFLPFNYHVLFIWYIIIHLPLAFWGMVKLMKNWQFSSMAAWIAAFAYAFGGGLLFQYSNPIFLIGPSWIPWGIFFGDRLLRNRTINAFLGLAFVLAMTVLCGDPESGYFIGLILIALCFCYWKARTCFSYRKAETYFCYRKTKIPAGTDLLTADDITSRKRTRIFQILKSPFFLLIWSAIFAMGLSAVQILPTLEFVPVSDRSNANAPCSIWQIPHFLGQKNLSMKQLKIHSDQSENQPKEYQPKENQSDQIITFNAPCETNNPQTSSAFSWDALLCRNFDRNNPAFDSYHFSISPLYWSSFFCPNFCGNLFPYNSRWGMGSPDDRIWTLSLYMGIIPILLALSVFKLKSKRIKAQKYPTRSLSHSQPDQSLFSKRNVKKNLSLHNIIRRCFSWIAFIFLLGTLGGYGPIWLIRALTVLFGFSETSLNVQNFDPLGGVYWFFQTFLPFFSFFRYPGKLLAPALLALAVLSGIGWDLHRKNRSLKILLLLFSVVFFSGILFLLGKGAEPFHKISLGNQSFFGLYQPDLAWRVVLFGLLQALAVTVIFLSMLWMEKKQKFSFRFKRIIINGSVLILISLDLFIANQFLIASVPRSVYNEESSCRKIIEKEKTAKTDSKDFPLHSEKIRIYRMNNWFPQVLLTRSAPTRLSERIAWERSTLGPRYHLLENISLLNVYGTMSYNDFKNFDSQLNSLFLEGKDPVPFFQFSDVSFLFGTEDFSEFFADNTKTEIIAKTDYDLSLEERKAHRFPVETVILKIKNDFSPQGRLKLFRMDKNFSGQANVTDTDKEILEKLDLFSLDFSEKKRFSLSEGEKIEMISYRNSEISFEVLLKEPAEIILLDQFDRNWKATRTNEKGESSVLPIYRALKIFRGVSLPAGKNRIIMSYSPNSFYFGAAISIIFFFSIIFFHFLKSDHLQR